MRWPKAIMLLGFVLAAVAGYRGMSSEPASTDEIPSSERQMPDFNPPIESDRPDLWEEPRPQANDGQPP